MLGWEVNVGLGLSLGRRRRSWRGKYLMRRSRRSKIERMQA
jgi:hypothetical protein